MPKFFYRENNGHWYIPKMTSPENENFFKPAKCHVGVLLKIQIQQQLHYGGEHSCRAPSAPPANAKAWL